MLAREILPPTREITGYVNGTLALDKTHHLGNRILGGNTYQHMHVIHSQMAF